MNDCLRGFSTKYVNSYFNDLTKQVTMIFYNLVSQIQKEIMVSFDFKNARINFLFNILINMPFCKTKSSPMIKKISLSLLLYPLFFTNSGVAVVISSPFPSWVNRPEWKKRFMQFSHTKTCIYSLKNIPLIVKLNKLFCINTD